MNKDFNEDFKKDYAETMAVTFVAGCLIFVILLICAIIGVVALFI